jgi:CMP-N,N'-diacetyllegionaminic acid synthase
MSIDGKKVLAVVPARGGSKGIVGKNLRVVGGRSLVGRAADICAASAFVDRAVLSTDSKDIAREGRACGLWVPGLRPAELANDTAASVDVWRHAWMQAEAADAVTYDIGVLLEPTSPMRTPDDVERTIRAMLEAGARAAATVSRTPAHLSPHKTLTIDKAGKIGFFLPDGVRVTRRQDIPPLYSRNGICYAAMRQTILSERTIVEKDCVAVPIERHVANIDEPIDLEFAEFLMQARNPE